MELIINADDFGITEEVNTAILNLFEHGIVSSTSIMARGPAFEKAVQISKDNPDLGMGVHLCLDGPYNIGKSFSSIIDNRTREFYNQRQVIKKIKKFRLNSSEIFHEYCLQVEKVLDHGISISHLDHHHHLHLYLPILNVLIRVARRYNIKYIRSQNILLPGHQNYMNALYRKAHQLYLKGRMNTTDGHFEPNISLMSDFAVQTERFSRLLNLNAKVIEVILHPESKSDPETRFFTSDPVHELLKNTAVINYTNIR